MQRLRLITIFDSKTGQLVVIDTKPRPGQWPIISNHHAPTRLAPRLSSPVHRHDYKPGRLTVI